MTTAQPNTPSAEWSARLQSWSRRLHALRLTGLAGVLLDVAAPLSPLGAALLWIGQPVLGLVAPRDDVAWLARLLEDPEGAAWLRDRLVGEDHDTQ